ncbi:hypothetical protein G9A89_006982 [Geosiphon pyriformis]|nr:hypothetical protein G9A89_006982 [Geosiphon pyriformis]
MDIRRLGEQIHQIQQPVESNLEEYEYRSNNPTTVQDKSTNCIQPTPENPVRNTTNSEKPTPLESTKLEQIIGRIRIAPSAQNPTESAFPLMERTVILQPIDSSNKEKQPALALREHSNTWIPILLNITSNTPPINQIMAYWNITKLEKFFGEEDNTYSWIVDAEKAITTNGTAVFSDWNHQFVVLEPCRESSLLRFIQSRHLANLQEAVILTHNFESAKQEVNHTQAINLAINETSDIDPEAQELINHHNGEKITTTADTHSNKTVSNSNNLGDLISTTVITAKNLNTLPKPIPATQILAKHGTPIFYTSESTAPIRTTSPTIIKDGEIPITIRYKPTVDHLDQSLVALPNFDQHQLDTQIKLPILGFDKSTLVERRDVEQIFQPSKQTKSNIPPATITEDTTLATIFSFNIDNLNTHSLFIGGIDIKLILDSGLASSIIMKQLMNQLGHQVDYAAIARIITADGNTKTLIGEIDNFPFEINGIQIFTKVLIMEATQYQALVGNNWLSKANAILDWNTQELQLTFNRQHAQVPAMCRHFKTQYDYQTELLPPPIWKEKEKGRAEEEPQLLSIEYITLNQRILFYQPPRLICVDCRKKLSTMDNTPCLACGKILPNKELWNDVSGRGGTCDEASLNRLDGYPHNDHKIWRMASTKAEEEQKQRLADLNTKLCNHCLISCYFQYCNKCDFMFNLPPRILFPIAKLLESKEKKILITKDMLFQDPTKNTETEQYFTYLDLSKELELKWYNNNEKRICLEKTHDTNASFDLQYSRQSPIIIAPYSLVKIDLKIALKIPISTMLHGKHHRDTTKQFGQTLQNRITRKNCPSYFLIPKLSLTAQRINGFGSSGRGNIPVNFMKENSDQVNRKIQDQALLFKASSKICSLADIANLYLPAKAHKHFKIPIYNPTENVIEIPEGILIGSISVDIQNLEKLQSIPDFTQLFLFCNIISQVWNLPKESYLFIPEKINKLNLGNLSTLQQIQLKVLLNQYADVFASKNEFRCTDIIKH